MNRTMDAVRIALAGAGWGTVLGMLTTTVLLWREGAQAVTMGLVYGCAIGFILGAVLGLPVGIASAVLSDREPRVAARWAVVVFLVTTVPLAVYSALRSDSATTMLLLCASLVVIAAGRVHRTVRLDSANANVWRDPRLPQQR